MITPIHLLVDLAIFFIAKRSIDTSYLDLVLLLAVNLIDLDHLSAKPIFKRGRDSFKTHFLHKNWKTISFLALIFLTIRPVMFLGIGILSHFSLDWIDTRISRMCRRK